MKRLRLAALSVIVLVLAVATRPAAATETRHPSDVPKGRNLALGSPYTVSVRPTGKFWLYEQRGVPLPDTDRLLTDGKFAKTDLFGMDHETPARQSIGNAGADRPDHRWPPRCCPHRDSAIATRPHPSDAV